MSLFDAYATAVVEAVETVYADDAVYTPAGGGGVEVRLVLGWQDEAVDFAGLTTQLRVPGLRGELARDQLAGAPAKGDAVQVLTGPHVGSYTVRDFYADVERSQWTLDLS